MSTSSELTGVAGWAVNLMETLGGPGAALAIAAENLFPPIPSEVILPLAGFTASQGTFTLTGAIVWTTLGSVVGALALYLLGALVLEALSGYFWRQLRPNVSELFATGEEMLEMTACIYAVHVMVAAWLPVRISPRHAAAGPGRVGDDPGPAPAVREPSSS